MDRRVFAAARFQQVQEKAGEQDTGQRNTASERAAAGKKQNQDDDGDIAVYHSVDHVHSEHFQKGEVGCCGRRQFAHIVFAEEAQGYPFQNIAKTNALIGGGLIADAFLCHSAKIREQVSA